MKKITSFYKYLLCLCISVMFCLCSLNNVFAAGVSITANKSTVNVGDKVTFTVSVSGGAGYVNVSGAANGKVWLDNSSQTYMVTARNAGVLTLNVSGVIADYNSEKDVHVSESKSVNVIAKNNSTSQVPSSPSSTPQQPVIDNRSKDNSLSSLKVSEGNLSPIFKPSTTKYSVNVSATTTKVTIQAIANDKKARVSGTGEKNLNVGKNTFVIKCIAENGNTRNYTIEINVDEKPLIYTEFNNQKLGVVRNLTAIGIPSGFKKSESKLENQKVTSWTNDKLGLTICYLIDGNNKKNFYVIDNNKVLYPFTEMNIDERHFIVIPIEEQKREGFIYQKVKINEIELDGWIYEDESMKDYIQVYLMNDEGVKQIYDYEITENQLQKYTESTSSKENIDIYMITSIILGIMLIITIGYIFYEKHEKNV